MKVAASYLLVLHNLEPLEQSSKVGFPSQSRSTFYLTIPSLQDTVRLLKVAMEADEWMVSRSLEFEHSIADLSSQLCRELLRFLYSLDRSGLILRAALSEGESFCVLSAPFR